MESANELKKTALTLLDSFLTGGPFSSEWQAKDALTHLADIKEQMIRLREEEAQLQKDFGIFNISQPDSSELAKLDKVRKN